MTAGSDELLNKLKCKSDKLIKLTRIRKVDDIPCIIEIDYLPDRFKFLLSQNLTDTSLTTLLKITLTIYLLNLLIISVSLILIK